MGKGKKSMVKVTDMSRDLSRILLSKRSPSCPDIG